MLGKVVLLGEPKSTQHIYKITCRPFPSIYMTPEGKSIKEDYAWQARAQWVGKKMITTPCGMRVRLFHKTKRKQDIDNYGKLLDSLNLICIEDDNLIQEMLVTKHWDKENPRIEIEYYDVGELTKYETMDTGRS